MRLSSSFATFLTSLLLHSSISVAESPKSSDSHSPCTAISPSSGRYFDLRPIWLKPTQKEQKRAKEPRTTSWPVNGYDIGYNFTINFCGPVIEELEDVVGVRKANWGNVSGFYEYKGDTYSIGQQNAEPVFRGRKLVLNYTGGSPCETSSSRDKRSGHAEGLLDADLNSRASKGDDDEDDRDKGGKDSSKNKRRKQTIISLLCESDVLTTEPKISFVASDEEQCTYFFEARTSAACQVVQKEAQPVGPTGVFVLILFIAISVYLVGGCVYQRNVMHQRGWRQLPNYALWAGIGNFVRDMFIILTSSCARFMPSRRGYSRVSNIGNGRPRGNHSEAENRLIDQLDEEWDD